MGQETSVDRAKLLLAYAAETRRFEIERFWQRTLFFWTVLGAAFVGYAALGDKDPTARLLIACFGSVASLAWTLQNRGAKYWQEAWEQKTRRYQLAALHTDLFSRREPRIQNGLFGAARYSVSRLAIILSDYTTLVWFALMLRPVLPHGRWIAMKLGPCATALNDWLFEHRWAIIIIVTLIVCALMLIAGRSGRGGGEKQQAKRSTT